MGNGAAQQAVGLFESVPVHHQVVLELRIQRGVNVALALTRGDLLPVGQQHRPVLIALQGEVFDRVRGLAKRVAVKPVSVAVSGQHPPRVRLAVDGGVGKPAGERQDVGKDGRWRVGQSAQLRIRIDVARGNSCAGPRPRPSEPRNKNTFSS